MTSLTVAEGATAANESVLIVYEAGEKETSTRLREELELLGLDATVRPGTMEEALDARTVEAADAVVLVTPTGATIWVAGQGDEEPSAPIEVERGKRESSDLLALRSAELVRGRLLPSEPRPESERASGASEGWPGTFERAISTTVGPAVFVRTFGGEAPGLTGDIAVWFGPVGVGVYAAAPFVRNDWKGTKGVKDITFRQFSFGLEGRLLAYQTQTGIFELQVIAKLGLMPLWLERSKGPEELQFKGTGLFLTGETGVEATFALTPWFRLGGHLQIGFDAPLSWPVPVAEAPPEPAADDGTPTTQGHLTAGPVAVFHF